jgi:hypothetical protein
VFVHIIVHGHGILAGQRYGILLLSIVLRFNNI